MNSKQIIRALNALFQLDDEDRGLVLKLWNLSESDREAFVQALQVQPQGKATTKAGKKDADTKKRNLEHCGVCDYTRRAAHHKDTSHKDYHEFHSRTERPPKSQRASSIQQQIQTTTRTTVGKPVLCTYEINGKVCHSAADDGIHDAAMRYLNYHKFQPARQAGSASSGPCTFRYPDDAPVYAGQICTGDSGNPIHDPTQGYAGYHPFVSLSPARNAGGRSSSPTTSPDGSKVNSEVVTESVSSATGD